MDHDEFVKAYAQGRVTVEIDPAAAARYLSGRLLLPFVALPFLGAGVGLALVGWLWTGLAVIGLGVIAPRLIKRSAPRFLLTQALEDAQFYSEVVGAGILRAAPAASPAHLPGAGNAP